jgi:hypothetical protein
MGFGATLSRLFAQRGLDAGSIARAVGVAEADVLAVLDGAEPPWLLRQVAAVLGWHASDLFLAAGLRPPEDLAPAARQGSGVSSLVWCMVYVPQAGRRVHALLRSLPPVGGDERVRSEGQPRYETWFQPGLGATLLRLFGNRNMVAIEAVKTLHMLTGFGPWSASTLHMTGHGRKEVPDELVAAAAVVLGIPAGDLAALADRPPPPPTRGVAPLTPEAVDLIWRCRDLTDEQLSWLDHQSHLIRHEYDDATSPEFVCHCELFHRPNRPPASAT